MEPFLFHFDRVVVTILHSVADLKVVLKDKEGFISDLMLDVYRYADDNERLKKKLKDADSQMVDSMKRIKDLSAVLQHFKEASKLLVDLVDPAAGEAAEEKTLLSRLQEAPQKLSAYVMSTVKSYVSTTLVLIKA